MGRRGARGALARSPLDVKSPPERTLVLDSGGVSGLATQRARLAELRRRGLWPAQVPPVVLTEATTGDHRRDAATNRFLRCCQIRVVDETLTRDAARLRTATGRAGSISATDAVARH